jgi:desulfoferrodoxin (superoxide reductase-like protein)
MTRRDDNTMDLFKDYTPPEVVKRFDEAITRAGTLRSAVARAVSASMKDSGKTRSQLASEMTDSLGEEVTENMLNAYASEARESHTIPYVRLVALAQVTGDARLLQIGAEQIGHVVADLRYMEWIKVGMEADRKEQITRLAKEAEQDFELTLRAARKRGI